MLQGVFRRVAGGLLLMAALSACDASREPLEQAGLVGAGAKPAVSTERLERAEAEPGVWLSHGRTYAEQRFSPLDQINPSTVGRLGLAWSYEFDTARGQEATPLVIDGVIYTTTAWSKVVALDARSGALLWQFDPQVPGAAAVKGCCDVVNRGLAAWNGMLYLGTFDGRLIALDARTGKPLWSVVTVDQSRPYTITGAPRVIRGKVMIGNGGAEFGVRGYISAYDGRTGRMIWRWYSVPGDPALGFEQPELAMAARTWAGQWWKTGGGGTIWDSMAYDPDLNLMYVGVGNGTPWNHMLRSEGKGDNLFLSSIVALDPDTGAYVWHYQTTPGESWDFTATQSLILADLKIDGALRKVIMQAPKNGFFYVLDRRTGELLSANNFVTVNWASGVDMKTGRPIENPDARFRTKPFLIMPSGMGAHNWHSMAFSPRSGLVYIPAQDIPLPYQQDTAFIFRPGAWNSGIDMAAAGAPDDKAQRAAIRAMLKGRILAWDPVSRKAVWSVEHGGPWNGGILATGGNLVFQGTAKAEFHAYAADSGARLWSFKAPSGIVAAPVSYMVDGEQYIAVMSGYGGAYALFSGFVDPESRPNQGRLLVFKLGGTASLPQPPVATPAMPELPDTRWPPATEARGAAQYVAHCVYCHGDGAVSGGVVPDLRRSGALADADAWRAVVMDGALEARGMVSFATRMSAEDAEAVRAYIVGRARLLAADEATAR